MNARSSTWSRSPGRRARGSRDLRRYLVVCEDEKSSRYYFEALRPSSDYVAVDCVGTGFNTDTLMEEAIRRKRDAESRGQPYVAVWCVFDRDEHPAERYSRAFDLARANGIEAIWSNEAFELWYVLHFHYRDTGLPRAEMARLIEKETGKVYAKGDRAIAEWFAHRDQLPRREHAIRYARKLLGIHGPGAPLENPSTRVHDVVTKFEEIRQATETKGQASADP